jgi:hypothetical protein
MLRWRGKLLEGLMSRVIVCITIEQTPKHNDIGLLKPHLNKNYIKENRLQVVHSDAPTKVVTKNDISQIHQQQQQAIHRNYGKTPE